MSRDDHRRDLSPHRRRSSPSDTHFSDSRDPSGGIQIRGLAKEREDRTYRDDHRDYNEFNREGHAHHEGREYPDPPDRRTGYDRRDHDVKRRGRSPPSNRHDHRGYRDRDQENYTSPERRYRSGSSSPARRDRSPRYGGSPSREVILEGLPPDISEEDITDQLKQYQVRTLEDVRVIRDRRTGISRQFGFIRFPSLEESTTFVERNYPTIFIYGNNPSDNNNQAAKVRIAFSREREERNRPGAESEWMCPKCNGRNYSRRLDCFRCSTPKPDILSSGSLGVSKPSQFNNTGDSDVSPDSTPSQYLIFRSLEPGVTESVLATGAAKLLKSDEESSASVSGKIISTSAVAQSGARQGSIRRVFLARDRRTDESWRYGFAEFMNVEDAQAALAKFRSLEKFTIASHPVLVDYIHAGVFKPFLNAQSTRKSNFSFQATANPALRLVYWDEDAYVKELVVSTEDPDMSQKPEPKVESSVDKGSIRKGPAEAKSKKRKAESAEDAGTKKSMPSHLQFWANRHAELHGIEPSAKPEDDPPQEASEQGSTSSPIPAPKEEVSTPQSFRDPTKHCCYLCARQFKTAAEVNKHERLSQLHQDNLKNPALVAKGLAKLEKAGITVNTSDYRDRAKERRAAFNQPKQPGFKGTQTTPKANPSTKPTATNTNTTTSGSHPSSAHASPRASPSPPPSKPNKGAALLSKMGWTAGSGLGAQGTGMTAPIETALYAEGVGLGAEGARRGDAVAEAARNTRGEYAEFLARTRDGARERYERLG